MKSRFLSYFELYEAVVWSYIQQLAAQQKDLKIVNVNIL